METYWHNETEVRALQVKRPYRVVSRAFPRSHQTDRPSGRLNYIRLVDAPEGRNRAQDGDWIVKYPNGNVEVFTDEEFQGQFTTTKEELAETPKRQGRKRVQARADQQLESTPQAVQ